MRRKSAAILARLWSGGGAVLAECRVGDWALMRAGEEQRQVIGREEMCLKYNGVQ